MSKERDPDFLADILEASIRAQKYISGLDYDGFMSDTKTQDAIIRTLEIVGEATKQLTPELRDSHANIPWKSMAGMRDRLIHDYFGVNLDIVWEVVTTDLPAIEAEIKSILDNL